MGLERLPPPLRRVVLALWGATFVCIVLSSTAGALMLVTAAGLLSGATLAATYLTLVVLHLIGAGQFFLLVVGSIMSSEDDR